ncbi:hypothetical protein D3C76_1816470 [compost metagenome]
MFVGGQVPRNPQIVHFDIRVFLFELLDDFFEKSIALCRYRSRPEADRGRFAFAAAVRAPARFG